MVKKKEEKKCCNGAGIFGRIFALGGMYLLTGGLIDSFAFGDVFTSPIFWGLFLIGMASCAMRAAQNNTCKV